MSARELEQCSGKQLAEMVGTLCDELGCRPNESISGAAFRILRLNIDSERKQAIARRVLEASGKPPMQQWQILAQCVRDISTWKGLGR